ncbi:MAG TPA: CPBP family intramembrane metalloprotease [Candidatus Paenibacillus intestinavium]|nr:CPBP family intramembrane metalloprotease [Candidatus Paenibacillus intestinavium]
MPQPTTKLRSGDPWNWKTFVSLIFLEFIIVMFFVKTYIQSFYSVWFDNTLYSGTLTGLTIAIILMLGLYYIAIYPQRLTWSILGLRRFPMAHWKTILLTTAFLMIVGTLVLIVTSYFGNATENSKTDSLMQNINLFTLAIALISAAVISPIYEEIFYRGFIYCWLRNRIGVGGGMIVSAFIFMIAHYPTTNTMPLNFLDGLVLAWIYERTGSIWPAVIVHGLINGLTIVIAVGL